jgi:hypothetical protein
VLRFKENDMILRSTSLLALLTVLIPAVALAQAGGNRSDAASRDELTFTLSAKQPFAVPVSPWTERSVAFAEPGLEKAAGKTIPTFTRKILARGRMYQFTMVGSDPFVRKARNTVVPVQIIPVRFEFDDGNVFDPTLPSLPCEGGETALNLTLESPVFQSTSYGDGNRQFNEEIRRLEFWKQTGALGAINPGYSVRVSTRVLPTARIILSGFPTQALHCGRFGYIDIKVWNDFVKATLFPQLRRLGVTTQTFPLFLFANVVMIDGDPSNCCILGYHSAFNSGGIQTYGVANYDFTGSDVAAMSHELAEWYDDPFGNNSTPPWGHSGQVDGCQANLEVGDPLSGNLHRVVMPNGLTYHPQELAFFSWFFNQVPSLGFNGWYSSGGSFLSPAALCN